MVVEQPKFTRVEEPTLLCNQVPYQDFTFPISALLRHVKNNLNHATLGVR
jgi:hypothetical protein